MGSNIHRIGLFGGSFDPVTYGHLLLAQAAREELELDRLFLIPAAQSPLKPGSQPAPAADRLRMLRLSLAGRPEFEIDGQEIARGGVSYTIDTMRDYVLRYPDAKFYYLIGSDLIPQLPKWREADELAKLLEVAIIPRPGEPVGDLPPPFRGRALKGFPLGVSSSNVRARVKAGLPIDWLVPPAVAEVIRNNRLYL